ncbi:flagellar hook assembly protein FlgD [Yersinia rohdei]|uniref:flagellar hook assembly protein FlgD n=1 Tax=Yersinia rohdei TaxID=29485 RepID=UPI0005E5BD37|nr:flagellar hook assembly protein FlgD [Yersinia rohdei]CQJ55386.1 flagellar basal body rod modification protein [Yersinia rohdei]
MAITNSLTASDYGVNSTTSTNTTSTSGSSSQDLQNSFLTLLVAQLKNQDPTNPMQNNELTTQLAQINTVSGIEKLNTTLGSISGQLDSSQSLQASTLIGHGVMIPGTSILSGTKDGVVTTTPFGIELERSADKVTATISDSNGLAVRTIEVGNLTAGVHSFTWDGSLDAGGNAPDGAYTVTIAASSGGASVVATPLSYAIVNGVTRGSDGSKLDLGLAGTKTMYDVRQIL